MALFSLGRKKKADDEAAVEPVAKAPKKKGKGLDSAKIQQFFVEHVEKLILGGVGVFLLYAAYSAISHPTFERTPEQLQQMSQQVQSQVAAATPSPDQFQKDGIVFKPITLPEPVTTEGLALDKPLSPAVLPVNRRRAEPQIFTVQELQAAADYGGFEVDLADQTVKGYYWVVVTGAIPFAEQRAEYLRCLALSSVTNEDDDLPVYFGYAVERAEVTSDDENAPLDWKRVSRHALVMAEGQGNQPPEWRGTAPEIVDASLVIRELADPLGPLVGKNWGSSVAHPKVPSLSMMAEEEPEVEQPPEETAPADDSPFGFMDEAEAPAEAGAGAAEAEAEAAEAQEPAAPRPAPRATRGGATGGTAAPPRTGGMGGNLAARGGNRGGMGGNRGGMGAAGRTGPAPGRGGMGSAGTTARRPEQSNYLLFRFFDFTAEEGKRYRYRVRVALKNPNRGIEVKHLAEGVDAAKPYLVSEPSEPSSVVTVARANNVLAGPAKPARGANEVKATLLVRQFDRQMGIDVAVPMEIYRGQLMNYDNHPVGGAADGRGNPSGQTANLRTDTVLIDISGGEPVKMPGETASAPAVLALIDSDGRLVVRDELGDSEEFNQSQSSGSEPSGEPGDEEPSAEEDRPSLGGGPRGRPGGDAPKRGGGMAGAAKLKLGDLDGSSRDSSP